jgi:predicted ATPase/DNA-binding winged helix-turn-helix (wHTH) protein
MPSPAFQFEAFEYDPSSCRLLREGEALPLQPRVLDALALFLDRPGDLVARDELMTALWPDTFVTDNSLEQVISKLRRALGDTRRPRRFVESALGRGYRFLPAVTRVDRTPLATRPPTNLPPPEAGFIGRIAALAELADRLREGRLVTVSGSGGTGKTFLVRRFASQRAWAADVPDERTRFCDLSSAVDLRSAIEAVREGLDHPQGGRTLDALVDELAGQTALVILDNVEQVIPAVVQIVEAVLAGAPRVRIVTTSRRRMDLVNERCLELGPLTVAEGVQLLRDRAEAAGAGLGDALVEAVSIDIVEALECIPLAIRLAAPSLGLMSGEALLERLSERVGWLRSRARDLPTRQLSVQASVEWSWSLLSEEEQDAAARCAVFRGGLTLDAAEAVLDGDAGDLLMGLRDASLLVPVDALGEPRFSLQQPVREFALGTLQDRGQIHDARQRQARWLASLRTRLRTGLPEARRRAVAERENLWAAAAHAEGADLVDCVRLLYDVDFHTPDPAALAEALDRAVEAAASLAPVVRFGVLNERALFRQYLRRMDEAREDLAILATLAEEVADQEVDLRVEVEMNRGKLENRDRALLRGLAHFQRALARAEGAGVYVRPADRAQARAHALAMISATQGMLEQPEAALEAAVGALAQIRLVGNRWLEAIVLHQLGEAYHALGRPSEQAEVVRQALAIHEAIGDAANASKARLALAESAHALGCLDEAEALARRSLEGLTAPERRPKCLAGLGAVLVSRRDLDEAEQHLAHAEALQLARGDAWASSTTALHRAFRCALAGDAVAALTSGERALAGFRGLAAPQPRRVAEAALFCGIFAALAGRAEAAGGWLAGLVDPQDTPVSEAHRHLARAGLARVEGREAAVHDALRAFDALALPVSFELRWGRDLLGPPAGIGT